MSDPYKLEDQSKCFNCGSHRVRFRRLVTDEFGQVVKNPDGTIVKTHTYLDACLNKSCSQYAPLVQTKNWQRA